MALKTKAGSFYALIRHLLLVILLCLSFQKPKGQVFMIRSSCLQIFFKIGVLKNFANSQEHTCVGVSFNKIAGLQRDSRSFYINIVKFLRIAVSIEHLWWLLLYDLINFISSSFNSFLTLKPKLQVSVS